METDQEELTHTPRTDYLAAIGLIQRPLTQEQQELPPLPLPQLPSPHQIPQSNNSSQCPPGDLNSLDSLSKMEAAFAKYLGIEPPDSPPPEFLHSSYSRRAEKSSSSHRPASEDLKSTRASLQYALSRPRPSSLECSSASNGNGFRAWFNGVSKSLSNPAETPSQRIHRRHRSSISAFRSSANLPPDLRRPSVSGPIDSFNLHPYSSTFQSIAPSSPTPISPLSNPGPCRGTRTWSSMMDPSTLSLFSEKEKNRQEAIFELIKTEAGFVENCQILSQTFYAELAPLIGSRAARNIFANIEDIMTFGTKFLSALEQRQLESGSHISQVGDIVMAHIRKVDIFRPYCSNQSHATRILNDLKQNPAVADLLGRLKVKGLEFEHYLLEPMQRLTRYPLLISQIIKYTDENKPDCQYLGRALIKVQEVLQATNEAIRQEEDHFKLVSLSEELMIPGSDLKLNLAAMTRFVGPRRLIREGVVAKSRSRKILHAYLFNDFFLLTKPSALASFLESSSSPPNTQVQLMYRPPLALEQCQFMPGKDDHSFLLLHASDTFTLKVPDGPKTCAAWLADLKSARSDVLKAHATCKSKRATWALDRRTSRPRSRSLDRPDRPVPDDHPRSSSRRPSFGLFQGSSTAALNKKSIRLFS